MNPRCPACLRRDNTPSLDIFKVHKPDSRWCFRCEAHFDPIPEVELDPMDLAPGIEAIGG